MPGPRFRLLTINLFSGFVDADAFAEVLDRLDPDVMLAQELAHRAAEVIASRFPRHHLRPDHRYSGWGMASRLPIEITPERPGWGRGGHGRVEVEGRPVHIAGAHILDPMHRPLRQTGLRRLEQADALVAWGQRLPPGEPQVVAGDMNATPAWEVYRKLAARWDDLIAAEAAQRGGKPARTWGVPGRSLRLLRIDHVFGTGVRASNVVVEGVKGSDHAALVVDLELT
ncbi:MAG TPA: endonuclease/exonuclease/phosphatase family protein [Acidimicrobiia bacterium]